MGTERLDLTINGGHSAPVRARIALRAFNGSLGERREDVQLLISELVTNAVRHSRAQRITVRASTVRSIGVRLSIVDDGRGITRERTTGGFGMTSMQERAERIGASLTIVTAPRSGTEVVLAWEPSNLPTQVHVAV